MSLVNVKTVVQVMLEIELEAIENGVRKLGFGNQFDETVIESAIENLKDYDLTVEDAIMISNEKNIMCIAHNFSTFEYPDGMYSNVN